MAANDDEVNLNGLGVAIIILMALGILAYLNVRTKGPTGPDDPCDQVSTMATVTEAPEGWFKIEAYGYSVEVPGPIPPKVDTPNNMQLLVGSLSVSECPEAPHRDAASDVYRNELKQEIEQFADEKVIEIDDVERADHPGVSFHIRSRAKAATATAPALPAIDQYGVSIVAHHRTYALSCAVTGVISKFSCDRFLASFTIP